MMSQANFVRPPRVASCLVNLFIPAEEAESILGDLLEEYSHLTSESGIAFARRWYWHQSLKTIAHLAGRAYRVAPWSTAATVVGGYLLGGFMHDLLDKVLSALTDRYLTYWSLHFHAYMFCAGYGILIGNLVASMLVGCFVALAAKGREMVATMTLSFVLGMMAVNGLWFMATRYGHIFLLGSLHYFGGLGAIIIGGALVRMRRSATLIQPRCI